MRYAGPFQDARETLFALLVAALVLVPYATIHLEYTLALRLQALALLGTLLVVGSLTFPRREPAATRVRPAGLLRLALLLYAAAVILGTVVGLASGSSTVSLAGQLLSLLFVPLAAVVGWRLGQGRWSLLVLALPLATVVAIVLHLGRWLIRALEGKLVLRLFFQNTVSINEIAPIALLLVLALAASSHRWQRAVALSSIPLLGVYIVGSASRSVWLIVGPTVLIYWLLAGARRAPGQRALWILVALLALVGCALAALQYPLSRPQRDLGVEQYLLPPPPKWVDLEDKTQWRAVDPPRPLTRPFSLNEPGAYRLRARIRGGQQGGALIALKFSDEAGTEIGLLKLRTGPLERWRKVQIIGATPRGTTNARVWVYVEEGAEGNWSIDGMEIHKLGSVWTTPFLAQGANLDRRFRSLGALLPGSEATTDHSLRFRFKESEELLRRVRDATPWRKLLGHGLGAKFSMTEIDPSATRSGPRGSPQNYIHNYYLFLLFKLGILGSLLTLAALLLVVAYTLRATLVAPLGPRRSFLAAATAILIGYSALALPTPVFLDFRLTPLWGLLVAAIAGAALEDRRSRDRLAGAGSDRR